MGCSTGMGVTVGAAAIDTGAGTAVGLDVEDTAGGAPKEKPEKGEAFFVPSSLGRAEAEVDSAGVVAGIEADTGTAAAAGVEAGCPKLNAAKGDFVAAAGAGAAGSAVIDLGAPKRKPGVEFEGGGGGGAPNMNELGLDGDAAGVGAEKAELVGVVELGPPKVKVGGPVGGPAAGAGAPNVNDVAVGVYRCESSFSARLREETNVLVIDDDSRSWPIQTQRQTLPYSSST